MELISMPRINPMMVVAGVWMTLAAGWSIFAQGDWKMGLVYAAYGFSNFLLSGVRG